MVLVNFILITFSPRGGDFISYVILINGEFDAAVIKAHGYCGVFHWHYCSKMQEYIKQHCIILQAGDQRGILIN